MEQADLNLLVSKLDQVLKQAEPEIVQLGLQLNQNEIFVYRNRQVKALTKIESSDSVFIFKDTNTGGFNALPGIKKSTSVINQRSILRRHTHPVRRIGGRPEVCELLNLAYIYRLRNEEYKTQQLWLVNFDGTHQKIMDVDAAVYVHPTTYNIEITNPGYHYKTFEVYQSTRYQISTGTILSTNNYIRDPNPANDDPLLNGYRPPVTTISTQIYADGAYEPPEASTLIRPATLEESWSKAILPYTSSNFVVDSSGNLRPDYTTFDNRSLLPNTWGGAVTIEIPTSETPSGIRTIIRSPWTIYSQAYMGTNQSNPDSGSYFVYEDGSRALTGEVTDYMVFWRQAAIEFVTSWDGPFVVTVPAGQFRPPDTVEYQENESYLSFDGGHLTALVRLTGRAEGVNPPDDRTEEEKAEDAEGPQNYNAGTTYAIGDSVSYTGLIYTAIAPTTGNLPTDEDYWVLKNPNETTWGEWSDSRYQYFPDRRLFMIGAEGLEEVEPDNETPEWLQPLYEHALQRGEIADILNRLSNKTSRDQLLSYVLGSYQGYQDYWIEEENQPVDSGVETVAAWKINFEALDTFQSKLFTEEPADEESPKPTPPQTTYNIYSIHSVEDDGSGDPGHLQGLVLPLAEEVKAKRVTINLGWDSLGLPDVDQETLDDGLFSVEAITGSWSRNSVYFCRDTKNVETPEPGGS